MTFLLPAATSAAQAGDTQDVLKKQADLAKVDFHYLMALAQKESSMRPDARAKTSSASGLFQFVEQTWLETIHKHKDKPRLKTLAPSIHHDGKTYRVRDPERRKAILDLRFDPSTAAQVAALWSRDNAARLRQKLGREPVQAEVYLAHLLGSAGARKAITALESGQASRPAAELFPSAAKANRDLFFSQDGKAVALRDVARRLQQGFEAAATLEQTARPANRIRSDTPPRQSDHRPHLAPAISAKEAPDTHLQRRRLRLGDSLNVAFSLSSGQWLTWVERTRKTMHEEVRDVSAPRISRVF